MPEIGELQGARKLGYRTNCLYIWLVCSKCGKERWVRRKDSIKENYRNLCKNCSYKQFAQFLSKKAEAKISKDIPNTMAHNLGLKARCRMYQGVCPKCGGIRWVQKKYINKLCRICSCKEHGKYMLKEHNPKWQGGKAKQGKYMLILLSPNSPFYSMANKHSYILEHRLIIAQLLDRCLHSWEVVHHKNRIKSDNKIENLELLPSALEHAPLTKMEVRISELEKRVILLEAENTLFKAMVRSK